MIGKQLGEQAQDEKSFGERPIPFVAICAMVSPAMNFLRCLWPLLLMPGPLGLMSAPTPGEVNRRTVEGLPQPVLWQVPKGYQADRSWPVLIFYHGTNGRPSLELLSEYTQGENFILIGMTYVRPGRFQYSEEKLQDEIAACHRVIDLLAKECQIDRKRIYVGGFSKGGWVSAMFIDHDHRFAGGFVMGGGVYDRQLYDAKKFTKRTPVYIGVGQKDGNAIMSLNAKVHFRNLGAEVCLEEWPDLGHRWPLGEHRGAAFAQWLELQAMEDRPTIQREKTKDWFEKELKRVKGMKDPVFRYQEAERLVEMPGTIFLGKSAREQGRALLADLRKVDPVKTEWGVQQRYRRIVRYEMKDRFLETLKKCSLAYRALAKKHPKTIYGKRAAIDYERTRFLIEQTERRQREKKAH